MITFILIYIAFSIIYHNYCYLMIQRIQFINSKGSVEQHYFMNRCDAAARSVCVFICANLV